MSFCIVLIEERKTLDGGLTGGRGAGAGFCPAGGIGAGGMGLAGIIGGTGLDGGEVGTAGLTGGIDLLSLIGKFGGILISGVRGLAVLSIAFSGGGGPLGFGGVIPLGVEGFVLTEDGEGGGVVDPEIGGLISSAISTTAKRKT